MPVLLITVSSVLHGSVIPAIRLPAPHARMQLSGLPPTKEWLAKAVDRLFTDEVPGFIRRFGKDIAALLADCPQRAEMPGGFVTGSPASRRPWTDYWWMGAMDLAQEKASAKPQAEGPSRGKVRSSCWLGLPDDRALVWVRVPDYDNSAVWPRGRLGESAGSSDM